MDMRAAKRRARQEVAGLARIAARAPRTGVSAADRARLAKACRELADQLDPDYIPPRPAAPAPLPGQLAFDIDPQPLSTAVDGAPDA